MVSKCSKIFQINGGVASAVILAVITLMSCNFDVAAASNASMKITPLVTGFSIFGGIGASAFLTLFPFSIVAEIVLAICVLGFASVAIWFIIDVLFGFTSRQGFRFSLVFLAGSILGGYSLLAASYFLGYLGDTNPKDKSEIYTLKQKVKGLDDANKTLTEQSSIESGRLRDALATLSDPKSIEHPRYNLATDVRLQFAGNGSVTEIDSHNLTWSSTDVETAIDEGKQSSDPIYSGDFPKRSCNIGESSYMNDCEQASTLYGAMTSSLKCPTAKCPSYTAYATAKRKLFFLYFNHPINFKDISLNSYGSPMPNNKIIQSNSNSAIILFESNPQGEVIQISIEQNKS